MFQETYTIKLPVKNTTVYFVYRISWIKLGKKLKYLLPFLEKGAAILKYFSYVKNENGHFRLYSRGALALQTLKMAVNKESMVSQVKRGLIDAKAVPFDTKRFQLIGNFFQS